MDFKGCFFVLEESGPCKFVSKENGKIKVELFHSPLKRQLLEVKQKEDIIRHKLFDQTRVYVELADGWRMGRVVMYYDKDDGTIDYRIQFPNDKYEVFSERDIFARCLYEHDDPTENLANGIMETQFWHDLRQKLTETFAKQISACRGQTSLISSNIELIPHQIDVAHRVLSDPLQRYLLADEVGMGKTIEAGLIIKQFLTVNSEGQVLVITPNSLLLQWESELEKKFLAFTSHPDRVFVAPIEEVENLPISEFELLVIDEAHNFVKQSIPNEIKILAKKTPRVLLLSATPALGDAQVLLNLLRLLDPDNYDEMSLVILKERIQKSQEYGIFLSGLITKVSSDKQEFILKHSLNKLNDLFPNDPEIDQLGQEAGEALENKNHEKLYLIINQLRFHIADVYRIHHRLIRNRRKDVADWVFTNRGPEVEEGANDFGDHVTIGYIKDSRFEEFFILYEQWLIDLSTRGLEGSELVMQFGDAVKSSFETIGSGLDNSETILNNDLIGPELKGLFAEIVNQTNTEPSRAEQVASFILECRNKHYDAPKKDVKICIFGNNKDDLVNSAESLKNLRSVRDESVKLAWEIDTTTENLSNTVKRDSKIDYLFCSREEEEGLNLEFCNALIHLDLPFDPSRIEQRIGRLDRYGRISMVDQCVILPFLDNSSNNLWKVWLEVLSNGFKIFNESIADVQLSLEELIDKLTISLIYRSDELRNSIPIVINDLKKERAKNDNQYILDKVLKEEDSENSFWEELDDVDSEDEKISEAIHGWMSKCLKFSYKFDKNKGIYKINWNKGEPLLPIIPWAPMFKDALALSYTNTRSNVTRLNNAHDEIVQLNRVGCSLMSNIRNEYKWDDRGTAFATWRKILQSGEPEKMYFKLCYLVSATEDVVLQVPEEEHDFNLEEEIAFIFKLESYFQPRTKVMYVDTELNVVEDQNLLGLLKLPYSQKEEDYCDYNLGNDRAALFNFYSKDRFEDKCYSIREESENWIRKQSDFKNIVQNYLRNGEIDISKRIKRLLQREKKASQKQKLEIEREIMIYNLILKVLNKPGIRLDSIGVVILSSQSPQEFLEI